MNLARIEYYFAEFLSIMEMPNPQEWYVEVTKTADEMNPVQLVNGKLLIGQNIWFFGTEIMTTQHLRLPIKSKTCD